MWQEIKESGRLGPRRVIIFEEIDSTNDYAARLGRQGAQAGTVVLAETQSAGRGRLARKWLSPPGSGLYLSLIRHSRLPIEHLSRMTLAAGLALCEAVCDHCGIEAMIKWPNDLLLGHRKAGGILSENFGRQAGHSLVVIGIGLNVTSRESDFPENLRARATSLYLACGREFERGALLTAILEGLEARLDTLEAGGFPEILSSWRKKDATLGQTTTWLTPDGREVSGRSLGVDGEGLLHIEDDRGRVHQVLSGDLELKRSTL